MLKRRQVEKVKSYGVFLEADYASLYLGSALGATGGAALRGGRRAEGIPPASLIRSCHVPHERRC